jgi:proline racemase
VFEGRVERVGGDLVPTILGTAHVTAESNLLLDARDPLCWGIRPDAKGKEPEGRNPGSGNRGQGSGRGQ